MNVTGNLGVVRRTLIKDILGGRNGVLINYNPHLSPKDGIAQIICPRTRVQELSEAFKRRGAEKLSATYEPLGLSPSSKHIGERQRRAL